MRIRVVLVMLLLLAVTPAAHTLPDVGSYWEFYDGSGNVTGTMLLSCGGGSSSTGTTGGTNYMVWYDKCVPEAEWECPSGAYHLRNDSMGCATQAACSFAVDGCIGYPN